MVVITFSNKAARELQDRLAVLLGTELASQVIAGLLHSLYPSPSQLQGVWHEHTALQCYIACGRAYCIQLLQDV